MNLAECLLNKPLFRSIFIYKVVIHIGPERKAEQAELQNEIAESHGELRENEVALFRKEEQWRRGAYDSKLRHRALFCLLENSS